MHGVKREPGYPVLIDKETAAVTDEEKTEMLAETWRGMEATIAENENRELLQQDEEANERINVSIHKGRIESCSPKKKKNCHHQEKSRYISS